MDREEKYVVFPKMWVNCPFKCALYKPMERNGEAMKERGVMEREREGMMNEEDKYKRGNMGLGG